MLALPGMSAAYTFGRNLMGLGGAVPTSPSPAFFPSPSRGNFAADQALQDVFNYPWKGSAGELDMVLADPPEVRRMLMDHYRTEPVVKAAIDGGVNAVACLKMTVNPADKNKPLDVEAGHFIEDCIRGCANGLDGLIADIYRPGKIFGWSIGEVKLKVQETGRWAGSWMLDGVRNLNTDHIKLQLDQFRNITGVVNLVRGIQDLPREKFLIYTHNPIFNNPFGISDMRAVHRAANLIREVYQVWFIALKRYGLPYMHGQVSNPNYRGMLEQALEDLQGQGWTVTGVEDNVNVINLAAAASATGFESAVRMYREDIFFATRGAASPFLQTGHGQGDVRHDSKSAEENASDPSEKRGALAVARVINKQLIPILMRAKYPPTVGMPVVEFAGTDWGEINKRLDAAKAVKEITGIPPKAEEVFEAANFSFPDPNDPMDAKMLAATQQAMPGAPGAGPGAGPNPPQNSPPDAPKPTNPSPNGVGPKPGAALPKPAAPGTTPAVPKPGAAPPGSFTAEQVTAAVDELLKELVP